MITSGVAQLLSAHLVKSLLARSFAIVNSSVIDLLDRRQQVSLGHVLLEDALVELASGLSPLHLLLLLFNHRAKRLQLLDILVCLVDGLEETTCTNVFVVVDKSINHLFILRVVLIQRRVTDLGALGEAGVARRRLTVLLQRRQKHSRIGHRVFFHERTRRLLAEHSLARVQLDENLLTVGIFLLNLLVSAAALVDDHGTASQRCLNRGALGSQP